MFDESYCVGMTLGPPEINIEGLNELATRSHVVREGTDRGDGVPL
jgi:uncharacterized protein YheU (UPF0270 family)